MWLHPFRLLLSLGTLSFPRPMISTPTETNDNRVEQANVTVHFVPNVTQSALSLQVELAIAGASFAAGRPFLSFSTEQYGVRLPAYSDHSLHGKDDQGDLTLSLETRGNSQQWSPSRSTRGVVKIAFHAVHTSPDRTTRAGPYIDFRLSNGCLIGTGFGFIPEILANKVTVDQLTFDLEATKDISAAWTYGDIPAGTKSSFAFDNDNNILQSLVFAFGRLRHVTGHGSGRTSFHAYWAQDDQGHKVLDLNDLAEQAAATFDVVGTTLTHESARPELRMFIVENPYASNGASTLPNAYILGHSMVLPRPLQDFVGLVAHEAVHLFLSMTATSSEPQESVAWFNEGIAEYYAYLLSWQHSLYDREDILASLNSAVQTYYTSPVMDWRYDRCVESFWEDTCAQTQIYGRGLMFFLLLDHRVRSAWHHGARYACLHDVLCDFQGITTGKRPADTSAAEFFALLADAIGPAARELYNSMIRGDTINLPKDALCSSWGLEPHMEKLEVFDLGFSESCLRNSSQPLEKLNPESRAAQAGLRDGDLIIEHTPLYEAIDSVRTNLTVTVLRPTTTNRLTQIQEPLTEANILEVLEVSFWPRGTRKVATPQYHVLESGQYEQHNDLKRTL